MIYYIFNYKDVNLKVFDAPILSTEAPDLYAERVERTLKAVKPFDYQFAQNKVLYYFGTFDDVKGEFSILESPSQLVITNEVLPPFAEVVDVYKKGTFKDEHNDQLIYRIEFNAERERLRLKELEKEKDNGNASA